MFRTKLIEKIKTHIYVQQHFPPENLAVYETLTYLLTPWSRVLLEKLTGM
jgi:hypothetical protein